MTLRFSVAVKSSNGLPIVERREGEAKGRREEREEGGKKE